MQLDYYNSDCISGISIYLISSSIFGTAILNDVNFSLQNCGCKNQRFDLAIHYGQK